MTIRSKLALPLAAALVACFSFAPAAFAQDTKAGMSKPMADDKMAKPDAMTKPGDAMKKDAMDKDSKMAAPMKKDGMKK